MKTRELMPTDSKKSFYGKAKVLTDEEGTEFLRSYSTIVASITTDGKVHRHWRGWSATTGRHIKSFCGLNKAQYTDLPFEYTFVG